MTRIMSGLWKGNWQRNSFRRKGKYDESFDLTLKTNGFIPIDRFPNRSRFRTHRSQKTFKIGKV
ncbi:hypothetical protein GCM10011571_13520 [Marinithermofilum abyssi]|uniref:Uncharacterized protein n=1 Tax=Marinithermofilum abyssi TaxID=1571185 RepID=A0A8J2YDS1_9BACL|nr:hypothetical protein GCM10011571_13520 [Marinithermofilum abyssi]